jgi:uncharacterized protein YndB with AHSA1/START domain
MSGNSINGSKVDADRDESSAVSMADAPPVTGLERLGRDLPPLHLPPGQTLVRDRWERLVSAIEIPGAAPEDVWHALTSPGALKHWLAVCHGSLVATDRDCTLDFEDGEFFLVRSRAVERPHRLEYVWRWLGIGQATRVEWQLEGNPHVTRVTVTEEAMNPPWDWQTWNGGGWPGILDQLAAHLRTGTTWRWPWRRMGPYAQVELPVPFYQAWEKLTAPMGLRFWLQVMRGEALAPGASLGLLMGDASGALEMKVLRVVQPGEQPPSFLPSIEFALTRPVWNTELHGRMWLEPAGWGRCLLQVFHANWENLPPGLQLPERKLVTSFWAGAAHRARLLAMSSAPPDAMGPHSW